jgi:hypothetical protein
MEVFGGYWGLLDISLTRKPAWSAFKSVMANPTQAVD